jgi:hypothetical protein
VGESSGKAEGPGGSAEKWMHLRWAIWMSNAAKLSYDIHNIGAHLCRPIEWWGFRSIGSVSWSSLVPLVIFDNVSIN